MTETAVEPPTDASSTAAPVEPKEVANAEAPVEAPAEKPVEATEVTASTAETDVENK